MEKYREGEKKIQEAAYKRSQLKLHSVIYMIALWIGWREGRIMRVPS